MITQATQAAAAREAKAAGGETSLSTSTSNAGDGDEEDTSDSMYNTADEDTTATLLFAGEQLVHRSGKSVSAEWLAAGVGGEAPWKETARSREEPALSRRSRSSTDADRVPAPVLRKVSSLTRSVGDGLAFGGETSDNQAGVDHAMRRKVSFREEILEETQLYAPTPTKRNPGGVGKTPARLAPFSGGGTARELEEDGSGVGFGFYSQQRALRQAAGRWVIPPSELKLGRRIGSGSFGEVFSADWNGTEVALKQMHDKSLTGAAVEEFSGEIKMMQGLRHPNIVLFLGAVIQAPTLSIVCELMPLGSLHSLLHGKSRGGVELSRNGRLRRQMAQDCARGMSYLHSRSSPVVHHDLKPANLLVDSHWTLKVSDFGMSRLKHSTYLSCKSPGGTPEWMVGTTEWSSSVRQP